MRKRRVRQATQVDDIRAIVAVAPRPRDDPGNVERRRIHDLGEDEHVVARQVHGSPRPPEELRNVLEFHRAAHDRHAEVGRQSVQIATTPARHQEPRCCSNVGHAPADQVARHEAGDAEADLADVVAEFGRMHRFEHLVQALLRELSREEQNVIGHRAILLAATAAPGRR